MKVYKGKIAQIKKVENHTQMENIETNIAVLQKESKEQKIKLDSVDELKASKLDFEKLCISLDKHRAY